MVGLKPLLSRYFSVAGRPFEAKWIRKYIHTGVPVSSSDENRKAKASRDAFPEVATLNHLEAVVKSLTASHGQMVLYLARSPSKILTWLLSTPMVLEALSFPSGICFLHTLKHLGIMFSLSNTSTVNNMSLSAYNRAQKLSITGSPVLGVGFLSPPIFWSRAYRFILSIRTVDRLRVFTVELSKGLRTKEKEDEVLSHLLFQEITKACMVGVTIDSGLTESELKSVHEWEEHYNEDQQLMQVINGQTCYKIYPFSRGTDMPNVERKIILSGSFSPLHDDHIKLLEVAASICGDGYPCFEIPAIDSTEPPMSVSQIKDCVKQFEKVGKTIIISSKTSVFEKAKLFPGSCFVIGTDTLSRLPAVNCEPVSDPDFFEGFYPRLFQKDFEFLRKSECTFLVFGQTVNGTFKVLEDLDIPIILRDLFVPIPREMFRMD